jgi:hypothetical protein
MDNLLKALIDGVFRDPRQRLVAGPFLAQSRCACALFVYIDGHRSEFGEAA